MSSLSSVGQILPIYVSHMNIINIKILIKGYFFIFFIFYFIFAMSIKCRYHMKSVIVASVEKN